ncbi:hypothetical protein BT96DRAFT_927342, partial [Gymnopus androsaceus JB14]
WFADFSQPDYGIIATDSQLRKLGRTTTINRGVPTLQSAHKLREKGKVLTAEQAQLLKLISERMVTFTVLDCQIEGPRLAQDE